MSITIISDVLDFYNRYGLIQRPLHRLKALLVIINKLHLVRAVDYRYFAGDGIKSLL